MAYEIIRPNFQLPVRPASTIIPRTLVKLVGTSGLLVLPVASSNDRPFGITGEATSPLGVGDGRSALNLVPAEIREEGNIVKAIAGASLGAGAEVTVATIGVCTAVQGASAVATVPQLGPLSAASGTFQWAAGISLDAAPAGSLFTLYLKPRLSGPGGA